MNDQTQSPQADDSSPAIPSPSDVSSPLPLPMEVSMELPVETAEEIPEKKSEETFLGTPSEKSKAERELEEVRTELSEMTNVAKAALADLANYRKTVTDEKRRWSEYAVREVFLALLPTVDSFEKAMHHIQGKVSPSTLSGLDAVYKQFSSLLEKFNVHSFESVGKPFDPMKHEALLSAPGEKDMILEEIEKGYMMGDKILRPTKVKVGNGA